MSEALKKEAGAFRFVDISASREIRKTIDVAREISKYPVLISSKPGMLKMIIEATGFGTSYRFVKDLSDTAVARLYRGYRSKQVLIVDEVQNLDLRRFVNSSIFMKRPVVRWC